MIRDLVFHLGDRKTGSTSIQKTLTDGLWDAPDRALFYTAQGHNGPLAQALASMGNADAVMRRFKGLSQRLDAVASDADVAPDVAVVSSETFEDVSPKALKLALEAYMPDYVDHVRLIAYVRPHAGRLLSGYSEQIKRGQSLASLEEFFAEGVALDRFAVFERFANWRAVFGDAFTLRPMIRSGLYNGCVVQDFLSYALNSTDFTLSWDPDANPSLSLQDIEVLRGLHSRLDAGHVSPAQASFLGAELGKQLAEHPDPAGSRLTLPAALADQLIAQCEKDAADLDQMFFEGTPMGDALQGVRGGDADAKSASTDRDAAPDAARVTTLMGDWLAGL